MPEKIKFTERPIIYSYKDEICANCKYYKGGKYDMSGLCTHKKRYYVPVQFNFSFCKLGKIRKVKLEEKKPMYEKIMGV